MSNLRTENKGKIVAILTISIILIIFIGYSLFNYVGALKKDNSQKNITTEIAYLGQGLLRNSSDILGKYDEDRYNKITEERNRLIKSIDLLSKGGVMSTGVEVPIPNQYLSGQITSFQGVVNDIITNVNIIINEKNEAMSFIEKNDKYNKFNSLVLSGLNGLASNYNSFSGNSENSTQYLSIIGNVYSKINSSNIKYFTDDKNILNDDYISERTKAFQEINQQVLEISKLPEIIQYFKTTKDNKDTILSNTNNLYSNIQNMSKEANEIINILPKIISAKKYASQSDKLSTKLDETYMTLSLSLNSSNNGASNWLISFIISTITLFLMIIYMFEILSKTNDVSENKKSEKKLRDYIRTINEILGSFIQDGKLKKNVFVKIGGIYQENSKISSTLPLLKDIAHGITTENKDSNALLKEIEMDTSNLKENLELMISNDIDLVKKIDDVSPLIENAKVSLNEMLKYSKEINVENVKINVENSSEKINETISGFNKLKETMQESNKVIKKVSESTQGMSDNLDEIRRFSDKMQINALNTEVITDVIMQKINDPELLNEIIKINSYIKNVREISTSIINQPLKRLEILNALTSTDTGEAIRSLEQNIQEIVSGGESISKIQNLIKSINNDLKLISLNSNAIYDNTAKSIIKIENLTDEFKEIKVENRESIEDKNKMLVKIKILNEKISDKVDRS